MSGTLFVVATPIGNLEDLSPRARQTLAEVELVAAEDTRHTGRLLSHLGVKTPQFALHEHNEERAAQALIEQLNDGKSVALVSDAGTPAISDPGYRLVHAAVEAGVPVVPVTLQGTRSILRGNSRFPHRGGVRVTVGAPLSPSGSDWAAALALRDAARSELLAALAEPDLEQTN